MININKYKNKIIQVCKKYDVKKLTLFGSALSNDFKPDSDIDLLIEFNNAKNGIKKYMNIKYELENIFSKPVDLVMPKAINNQRLKKYIYSNTKELYEA